MSQEKDARARILIVEDELIIAQNLKIRLEKLGYDVTDITIDAEETRTSLTREVPDLVLMDIALYGGNDGVVLAKWIDRNYKIPVIYVTSHTDNSTFERASKSMPYGYLIKPFNPKELYNAIELALQRHQLLLQLSSSSHLLGSVLQSIGDAIVVAGKEKGILFMNESAEHLLETRYSEAASNSVEKLLPLYNPDDDGKPADWNLERIPDHSEVEFEARLRTTNRTNYLQVRVSRLEHQLQQDVPEGFLVIMRDITKRRKTENIILNIAGATSGEIGHVFFQSLTERLAEMLEMDFCILAEINEQETNLCSIAASASRDSDWYEFKPFSIKNTPAEKILASKKPLVVQKNIQQQYPNDETLTGLNIQGFSGTPLISSDGEIVGIIMAMNRDEILDMEIQQPVLQIFANRAAAEIERRRYEDHLITERNRANEMNALKNSFLANMSHEVRTPLNSIIGFSSLLLGEIKEKEQLEFLTFINDGGRRLLQTIEDLLDLSVLESEPDKISTQPINLEIDAREAVGILQNQARDKGLELNFLIKTPDVQVIGDPRMTGHIMRKVIGNAIKFTEEGSVIVEVDTDVKKNRKYGVIRVTDTGVGISPSFLPYIYDEFQQESSGMSRKFEGVGLGLTIAQKMVHLMNGTIEAESEKNKGSVFSIYLPLNE